LAPQAKYNWYDNKNIRRNENSFSPDHEPLNPDAPAFQNRVAQNARVDDNHCSNCAAVNGQLEK
jgi:hypothetical protein